MSFAPMPAERAETAINDPARHRASQDAGRRRAHVAGRDILENFVATAARLLSPRGMLTLIWRADQLAEVMTALTVDFGGVALLPVHAHPDAPAIRVLV